MEVFQRRRFLALSAGFAVAGCSLPRSAAHQRQILKSASKEGNSDYAIYDVSKPFMATVASWPMTGTGPRGGWISSGGGRTAATIAPGDLLDITIWDNEQTSLLTTPGQKQVNLAAMLVAPDGKIFVPYLERVKVSGMTTERARETIQQQLVAIAPSAQVQVHMAAGQMNSVDLVGGVAKPGSYPLSDGSLSVLNLISLGGGVPHTMQLPLVRLSRGGKSYVTTLKRLYENPGLDTQLRGGDKVIVSEDDRKFAVLGASGAEKIVLFPNDRPTALDAMASVGGVNATRGDPKGVLILREYPASAVRDGVKGPGAERVIFTIDLTTADGLFSAGKFVINPDDVIYVSESTLTSVRSLTSLIGSIFGLERQAAVATGNN